MNPDEATDYNLVLRYALGLSGAPGSRAESTARLAAIRLADAAHATLHHGLTGKAVARAWGAVPSLLHVRRPPGPRKGQAPKGGTP